MRRRNIICFIILLIFVSQLAYSEKLKIATANLYAGNLSNKDATKQLLNLKADIIVLLEWTGNNLIKQQ